MLQGMQKRSGDRFDQKREQDRKSGVVAETGRSTKMMQGYFEHKLHQKREDKRLRLDTTNRALNFHKFTDLKYSNGALNVSKEGVKNFTSDSKGPQMSHHSKPIQKKKLTFEQIKKHRETVPEFATGKKFKRAKGSSKKLNKGKRRK